MSPVVLYFASGESFYLGAALLLAAVAASSSALPSKVLWLRRLAIWLGLALMVMASPPFSWIVDAGFAAAFVFWLISLNRIESQWRWFRIGTTCALIVFLFALSTSELYRRKLPVIGAKANDHLVVLGIPFRRGLAEMYNRGQK